MTPSRDTTSPSAAPSPSPWKAPPSSKVKNAVQRAVTALLDELAPERVLKRGEQIALRVEPHRTPNGCILQAPKAAVSVSWFSGSVSEVLGELRVMVWRGVVSRRGSPRQREGATIVNEITLHPIEDPSDERVWRATDDTEYDTASLAAMCNRLLEQQEKAGK
ncbi:MAG: hypothetical protein ACREMS_09005 [Gemmatimonadaceae bacterium]